MKKIEKWKKVGNKIREKDRKKCQSHASWESSQGGSSLGATFQSLKEKSEYCSRKPCSD